MLVLTHPIIMPLSPADDGKKSENPTSFRLSPDALHELRALAKKTDVKQALLLETALAEWLDEYERTGILTLKRVKRRTPPPQKDNNDGQIGGNI